MRIPVVHNNLILRTFDVPADLKLIVWSDTKRRLVELRRYGIDNLCWQKSSGSYVACLYLPQTHADIRAGGSTAEEAFQNALSHWDSLPNNKEIAFECLLQKSYVA
jgi:hypothetical protein